MYLDNLWNKNLLTIPDGDTSMKARLGFLPTTIWKPEWSIVKELKSLIGDTGQSRDDAIYKSPSNALRGGGKGSFGKKASVFNPHLAQMILSAYAPINAKIYDPFAGGGTRGFIATKMGHEYYGRELRENEVERILEQQKKLGIYFNIEVGNAMDEPPAIDFDISITCPPYFNLEVYSDSEYDLSNSADYETFLLGVETSLAQTYSSLKNGGFAIWTVGNFRDKKGGMYHFSGDTIRLAKKVGFTLWDEIIFLGASGSAMQRCGQFASNRKLVRLHENILVLKKLS